MTIWKMRAPDPDMYEDNAVPAIKVCCDLNFLVAVHSSFDWQTRIKEFWSSRGVLHNNTSIWIKHLSSFKWWLHHKYKQSVQLKHVILIIAHLIHQDYVNKKLDFTKIGLLNLICLLSLGHFVEHELRSVIRLLSRPLNQPAYIDTSLNI